MLKSKRLARKFLIFTIFATILLFLCLSALFRQKKIDCEHKDDANVISDWKSFCVEALRKANDEELVLENDVSASSSSERHSVIGREKRIQGAEVIGELEKQMHARQNLLKRCLDLSMSILRLREDSCSFHRGERIRDGDSKHGDKSHDVHLHESSKFRAVANKSRLTEQHIPKGKIIQSTYKLYNATWYKNTQRGEFGARLLQKFNKSNERSAFTDRLWKFDDLNSERLFLYGTLLQQPWQQNHSNLENLRNELYQEGFSSPENFIVTKNNTPPFTYLRYYFNKRTDANGDPYRVTKDFFVNGEFWSKLPSASPFNSRGKPYNTCAVIGNSGILLNSNCGIQIDSYDTIFRCNAAPIGKFARDAGWKTNVTTFNPTIFYKRYLGLATEKAKEKFYSDVTEYKGHLWFPCFGSPAINHMCMKPFRSDDHRQKPSDPAFVLGHPNHFLGLWDFWKERNITKAPSTGFYLTHTALQLCRETHLYGFWPYPALLGRRVQLVPYHYFDKLLPSGKHGMNEEFSILAQYHALGILRVHLGECLDMNKVLMEEVINHN